MIRFPKTFLKRNSWWTKKREKNVTRKREENVTGNELSTWIIRFHVYWVRPIDSFKHWLLIIALYTRLWYNVCYWNVISCNHDGFLFVNLCLKYGFIFFQRYHKIIGLLYIFCWNIPTTGQSVILNQPDLTSAMQWSNVLFVQHTLNQSISH